MNLFGMHFHQWKPILQKEKYSFRGKECEKTYDGQYRICKECKNIQEFFYDSQGGCWETISECEQSILKEEIEVIENNFYFKKSIDLVSFKPPGQTPQ
jgi:hypothetical protein